MYILGISAYYHDSAACLLMDGEIVAAVQEERFTRIKNDSAFPEKSIKYCLDHAGITLTEISYIAYYEKPFLKFERLLETYLAFAPAGIKSFLKAFPSWLKDKLFFKRMLIKALQQIDPGWEYDGKNLLFTDHHRSHAASAFYPSPFHRAVILTADGVGEWMTTSVAVGTANKIENINHINFPHSLGLLYSAFTYYLGFKVNCDEYKVMGLSSYGRPVYVDRILEHLIDVKQDGSYRLNMQYFNYAAGLTMTSEKFNGLFESPPRVPGSEVTAFHMDIANSIQQVTELVMLRITTDLYRRYPGADLCLAGGVALNCVINGAILKRSGFKNIWIQPAAGDAGGCLGAAYAVYYEHLQQERLITSCHDKMQSALLGPSYKPAEIERVLSFHNLRFEKMDDDELYETIAVDLANQKVIGYFKGRMEFGPRALGARSIIADARSAEMQSILNKKIKFRESFRPFAPVVLEEYADEYFDLEVPSPYMLMVGKVRSEKRIPANFELATNVIESAKQARSIVPAITHFDFTARLQTVNSEQHPDLYKLITAFYGLTGCPMIINTSFNRMDEPIVCTPADAVLCYLGTGMDVLVIENYIVRKQTY